ncbi:MAG: hypothetical protein MI725_04170 [Pirellulales bacterium]|nr:hypothetical protein [Pirellulales bacterium]
MNVFKLLSFLILILGQATPVLSADTRPYKQAGVIDEIRADEETIVIGDERFNITSQIMVNLRGGKSFGLHHLKEGMPVGFNSKGPREDAWVQEIWILNNPPVDASTMDD